MQLGFAAKAIARSIVMRTFNDAHWLLLYGAVLSAACNRQSGSPPPQKKRAKTLAVRTQGTDYDGPVAVTDSIIKYVDLAA